jgi:hypothetical protein
MISFDLQSFFMSSTEIKNNAAAWCAQGVQIQQWLQQLRREAGEEVVGQIKDTKLDVVRKGSRGD